MYPAVGICHWCHRRGAKQKFSIWVGVLVQRKFVSMFARLLTGRCLCESASSQRKYFKIPRMIFLSSNIIDKCSCNDKRHTTVPTHHNCPGRTDNRCATHLTTFNLGTTCLSNKSLVCLNRSFFTNAAYAFSVVLTEAWPSRC